MKNAWIFSELCKTSSVVAGMTVDHNGCIYCTHYFNDTIFRIDQNDATNPVIITRVDKMVFTIPIKSCQMVWNNNVLYICYAHRILKYTLDTGNLSTLAGSGEGGHKDGNIKDATFSNGPRGIAVDKNGDLYITEWHCVRKINLSEGTVITIAGQTEAEGHKDGPSDNALFYRPYGIAVSEDGTIYVADQNNQCIRKIKDGIVSTIAGTPHDETQACPFSCPCVGADGNLIVTVRHGLKIMDSKYQLGSILIPLSKYRVFCIAEHNGTIFFGIHNRIMKLESLWKYERYLWIGYLKEGASYCPLATLPRDIIKEIANYLPDVRCEFN